eukprot:s100_g42.t1
MVHHAESVANQACVPEEGVPEEKPLSEVQPQDCPIFKGTWKDSDSNSEEECAMEGVTQLKGARMCCLAKLPQNLESLTVGYTNFSLDLKHVTLPSRLRSLTFGSDFNTSLKGVTLPSGLRSLTFGVLFNQSLVDVALPDTLETLKFGAHFDQSLESVTLPNNLRNLTFGDRFNQSLQKVIWPCNLQTLTFGRDWGGGHLNFARSARILILPINLQSHTFDSKFNLSLQRVTLPPCIQNLTFGAEFNQSLADVTLPCNLQNLVFGENFDQSLKHVILPDSLRSVTFGKHFNQSLHNVILPSSLESLIFGDGFNQSLERVTLPCSVEHLNFGFLFNQRMESVTLPSNLKTLTFGKKFNRSLEHVAFPSSLKSLSLGNDCMLDRTTLPSLQSLTLGHDFDQSLEHMTLPSCLLSLTFGKRFNQSLELVTLPGSIQSMTFGDGFNQSLDRVTLPECLHNLTFGCDFNQSLEFVTLPNNLRTLILGCRFNQSLERVALPSGLQSLTFGCRFNQSLERSLERVTLPSGLQSLTFGWDFNQSLERVTLPSDLQSLTFGWKFNQSLEQVTLPGDLQSLTFARTFAGRLNYATLPGGELIAFILRTARDFATRQTKNNEVDPTSVVAADLLNFHQDRFCGRWRLQPFSSDGHPVFARYDCSEKGSGQFFLYYRAAQKMWTIDAEVDKVAPAFAYTRNSKYKQGWWRMASWVVNKQMVVMPVESALGFSGQAVQVRGVDEQLTGSPEEYLVALNGIYLRQPREDNVNGQAHYVLEKPRRHLFYDTGMDCWCIAHICHSDEGVYAKSCNKTVQSAYMTMGQDQKVPEATVNFITAQEEAMAATTAATARPDQEEGDFPLLRWEDSSHDCMLFSNRKHQVCFLSSQPSRLRISMHPGLLQLLERNRVSVGESLDALTADHTKVLGCLTGVDRTATEAAQLLDGKYCLTGDAVLKMLAIFVRMRCGLPVILMGECGCGKTELVRYLCAWSKLPLLTLNVHGGTTEEDMDQVFREARRMAVEEEAKEGLVVFLDEINTSQHVNMLCEAVLERSYRGRALPESVTVLAALNPRRKRPQAAMTTGLVYGSGAEEEMSSLVYRVHAVPETVNDFLFDFGALTKKAEEMYIRSMVQNCWPESPDREQVLVTSILGLAQDFIRYHEGDPSAVSLRDVKRCLRVARWMQDRFAKKTSTSAGHPHPPSLVVAVALVYHYRLPSRERRHQLWVDLARRSPWPPDSGVMRQRGWEQLRKQKEENGLTSMENLLLRVQANVAKEFEVEKDVVMNEALAENVFVGLLCIMNRIPLFIVGKPGTSKTLCMQVLLSNLQGKQSKSKVLQSLPALRIMQYQCSPLSTADGIQRQFDAAGRFASNALDAQVVLLLDEVGLAEFSPDMPLKVLHGILAEPGTVAVVGLSNWRLDPAKMNRSVCLARPDPDSAEVGRTGAGLLGSLGSRKEEEASWLHSLSGAFWSCVEPSGEGILSRALGYRVPGARDWLGMRDYYSFVRAVRDGCLKHNTDQPNAEILCFAIQRNFGGQPLLLERMLQAMLPSGSPRHERPMNELLQTSLTDRKARHLLLASQGPALPWLQAAGVLPDSAEILLGSDFPEDASEVRLLAEW